MPKLIQLDISDIVMNVEDNSRRFTAASVEEMTLQLLDADRQLEPVGVAKYKTGPNKGKYRLGYGFRRVHALKDITEGQMAPEGSSLYKVQALFHEDIDAGDDRAMFAMNVVENAHRQELSAMDQSFIANKLLDEFAYTPEKVAVALGISKSRVSQLRPLMKLPIVVQEAIQTGMISGTTGYELSKEKDEPKLLEAFYLMTGGGKGSREDAKETRRRQAAKEADATPEGEAPTAAPTKALTATRSIKAIFELLDIYRTTDDRKLKGNRQKLVEALEAYREGTASDRVFRSAFEKYVPE